MNLPFHTIRPVTQAAEGLPRRRWSVAEIKAMVAAGILLEDERFELIGGEVVPMSPKGARHELVKKELTRYWPRIVPDDLDLLSETTLYISETDFLEPDFVIWPRAVPIPDLAISHILLLVEIADSSLAYDVGRKAAIYAGLGLREYWVINANSLVTRVHTGPGAGGFSSLREIDPAVRLVPTLAPSMAVCLADLGLRPAT